LYPNSPIIVNYENGGSAFGIPNALVPAFPESGVLVLTNAAGVKTHRINLCSIVALTLAANNSFFNADGSLKITFLPVPLTASIGSAHNCESEVRATLASLIPSRTLVNVIAGGNLLDPNPVTATAFAVAMLGPSTIVSTCRIEDIR
jgi:hypothetical protein